MGSYCAHDEISRGIKHRILQNYITYTSQEGSRDRVGLPALVIYAKMFRTTNNWDIYREKVEKIRIGGHEDHVIPVP